MKHVSKTYKEKYGTYILPASAGIFVILAVLAFINAGAINRQLHSWKLLPEPERLTELYYENHTKLPTTYSPGTPQSFAFTVHNIEYRTVRYSYKVTQSPQSEKTSSSTIGSQTVASGQFTLPQDGYYTQPITFTPADQGNSNSRSQVTTTITYDTGQNNESIHYWVSKRQ